MAVEKSNPAILAGLLGAAAFACPATAFAATADGADGGSPLSVIVPFGIGVVTGIAVARAYQAASARRNAGVGEGAIAADEAVASNEESAAIGDLDDDSLDVTNRLEPIASAEPEYRGRHFRKPGEPAPSIPWGSAIDADASDLSGQLEPADGEATEGDGREALFSQMSDDERELGETLEPQATGAFLPLADASESQVTGVFEPLDAIQEPEAPEAQAAPAGVSSEEDLADDSAASTARLRLRQLPQVFDADHPSHASSDYEDVAQNYVRRENFLERMAQRARGVREVLAERFDRDPFEDLPVIERADGTVGDVGTGWWNARLGDSVVYVGGKPAAQVASDELDDTQSLHVPRWMGDVSPKPTHRGVVPSPRPNAAAKARAAVIAQSVAEVDQGMFPAKRSASELDHDDMWEQALSAMGERLEQMTPATPFAGDAIGGIETIDDPEGLEGPTSFIPFRAPAGHPEVVDTETYVDYLIDDEFSRNRSQAARKSSRDYLRVIEGGSQSTEGTNKLARLARRRREGREGSPKHMAGSVREA